MPDHDAVRGDMPVRPEHMEDDRPLVAEEVVARYVAETVRRTPGVEQLHGSALEGLSHIVGRGGPAKGIDVREPVAGSVEIDIHVRVCWGVVIPDLARRLRQEVGRTVESLLDLRVERVTLFVDEVGRPAEEHE